MIERWIEGSLRNRGLVLIMCLALVVGGIWSIRNLSLDAIPDLSDTQVVVVTEWPGQAPQVVEDQVTQPLARAMLGVSNAQDVRGFSMFGSSFLYILFEDGTDLYWARARVLEKLSSVAGDLPAQARAELGPDATGVGWIYQYILNTGPYSPAHPDGLWWDPESDQWFAERDDPAIDRKALARLKKVRVFTGIHAREDCPLSGQPLVEADLDLSELRRMQDFFLRYELTSLEGVSEVASIGGYEKQYQITIDPAALLAHDISIKQVGDAIRRSNRETGARALEISESEYMIRGLGYLGTLSREVLAAIPDDGVSLQRARTRQVVSDLESIPVKNVRPGESVRLRDVARVDVGPQIRQGLADWNDRGEAVGAIVVMRHGENAMKTIQRVRDRLAELESALPPGVSIETGYDRSDLINRSVATLRVTLIKEMIAVAAVMFLFLLHVRSTFVAMLVLPAAVLASIGLMVLFGVSANIMSLGGIAIAIGVMVDCSIVMVDNVHRHLARVAESGPDEPKPSHLETILQASKEVGPALFFSLLVITISFFPIFLLGEQSGRLFRPLAYTKTFAMAMAAFLAVTLTPVLLYYFIRKPGISESRNPLTRILEWAYTPVLALAIRFRWLVLVTAVAMVVVTAWVPLRQLGTEFMPPLEEGDILYMPTTVEPGLSITKARELLHQTSRIMYSFPEVESVMGKIGRAQSATDPAPLNMIESTVVLHRDPREWRHVPHPRFFSEWPGWLRRILGRIWSESRPITTQELIYGFTLPDGQMIPGMDTALQFPGLANAWTMPIRARIDMLSTGIRTPVGIKLMGDDLNVLADLAAQVEQAINSDPFTARYTSSAYAERTVGGKYLEVVPRRNEEWVRWGVTADDLNTVLELAVGGMTLTETVEGVERYTVNLRYPREFRDNLPMLRQVLVATPSGAQVPLGQLVDMELVDGPPMIKSENARPTAWVYVELAGIDVGRYVEAAKLVVERDVRLPRGYSLVWSGQYEYIQQARSQFAVAIPLTLLGITVLLYLATRSWLRVLLIFSTLSFSVIGAVWFIWLLDYNLSVAVMVGIIALLGLDAETSLIMLLYLDRSHDEARRAGRLSNAHELWRAVHEGAVLRIRPKTMTVLTTIIGLMPLMFATGAGADTMRRLAAPMIGGLVSSFLLELILYPVIYYMARRAQGRNGQSLPFNG